MKTIELIEADAVVLADTLESSLSDLKTEIGRTDNRKLHADLKYRVTVIEEILEQLKS